MTEQRDVTVLHFDTSSNFHPFECDGPRKVRPNPAWDERLELERRREARNG